MRGFERLRDLLRNGERLVERDRTFRFQIRQRWPLNQLHHEREGLGGLLDAVDRGDVRMVQMRPGLPLRVGIVRCGSGLAATSGGRTLSAT
jgi:hypothetical protein